MWCIIETVERIALCLCFVRDAFYNSQSPNYGEKVDKIIAEVLFKL